MKTATHALAITFANGKYHAKCGEFSESAPDAEGILDAIWEAVKVDYPDEIEIDPTDNSDVSCYPAYEMTLSLGGEEIVKADCWVFCGWIAPGAHANIDGSGLVNWGSSQHGGWEYLDSDGQMHGQQEVLDEYEAFLRASFVPLASLPDDADEAAVEAASDLDSEIDSHVHSLRNEINSPAVTEPTGKLLWDHLDYSTDLVEIDEEPVVQIGKWSGTIVLIARNGKDFDLTHHADADDVEKAVESVTIERIQVDKLLNSLSLKE